MPVGILACGYALEIAEISSQTGANVRKRMCPMRRFEKAFTLLEVSIAVVMIGFLLSGGVLLVSSVGDSQRYGATQAELLTINNTLTSYYVNRGYLPCPAVSTDGIESFDEADVMARPEVYAGIAQGRSPDGDVKCATYRGYLPYVTLGVGANGDAWKQPYKYAVHQPIAKGLDGSCGLVSFGRNDSASTKITVKATNNDSNNIIGDNLAFLVLSTGKNGAATNAGMTGAFSGDGGCAQLSNEFEKNNCTQNVSNPFFRSGAVQSDGSQVVFDDLVTWVEDVKLLSLVKTFGVCDFAANKSINPFDIAEDIIKNPSDADVVYTTGDSRIKNKQTIDISGKTYVQGDLEVGGGFLSGGKLDINGTPNDDVLHVEGDLSIASGGFLSSKKLDISLGAGDDVLEIGGKVSGLSSYRINIDMGSGDDIVRIHGNVSYTNIKMGAGDDMLYIGGKVNSNVELTFSGTLVVYYENNTKPNFAKINSKSSTKDKNDISNITYQCRANKQSPWVDC